MMSRTSTPTMLLLFGLCLCLPVTMVFGKANSDAAESYMVSVTWTTVGSDGVVDAEGCAQCPLQLIADGKTKFFHSGKKIASDKINLYTGQSGTVIYDVSTRHALKVIW